MSSIKIAAAAAILLVALPANAATFIVDAALNSSTGGTGLATVSLTYGQVFGTSAAANDLWNAGDLPRWSNADGIIAPMFATGSDESGQPAGTLISWHFPNWTQHNVAAPFGSLVGSIGGIYQELGTNFAGPAWNTGVLQLWYWDQNNFDNTEHVAVNINVRPLAGGVPEPASWAMLLTGFGLAGGAMRRRRATVAA